MQAEPAPGALAVESKKKFSITGSLKGRVRWSFIVIIILFIACVVFLALFIAFNIENAPKEVPGSSGDICQSSECLVSAAYIAQMINSSANLDPCQDFYQVACGGWVAENADGTRIVSVVEAKNKDTLRDMLLVDDPEALEAVKKIRAYFRSCEDVETISKVGIKPLKDLIRLDDGGIYPTLQPSWEDDENQTFTDIVEYLSTVGDVGTNAFVNMNVNTDLGQTDNYIITFTQIDMAASERLLYFSERNSSFLKEIENAYRYVLTALGADEATAVEDAEDVVNFAIELAKATESPEQLFYSSTHYKRMILSDLKKMFPQFDWHRYLRKQFEKTGENYTITMDEMVAIDSVIYYTNLFALTDNRTLLNYGMWGHVYTYCRLLPKEFRSLRFVTKQERLDRGKACAQATDEVFPYATARLFLDNKFMARDNRIERMADRVSQTVKEMLQESNWITQTTKDAALKKLNLMKREISYPDFILNDTVLNSKSNMYTVSEKQFFVTSLDILKNSRVSMLKQLRKPADRSQWPVSPLTINAFYVPAYNNLGITMSILKSPYYSKEFSEAYAYGSIGTVIAHEIIHGFDDKGSTHDEKGNLRQWWAEEDLRKMRQRTQCLVDQYKQFQDNELNMRVDGLMTLGENIADNSGVRLAFRAYRNAVKERGREEERLPTLPYTPEQLFFIGFAQPQCGNGSHAERLTSLLVDSHSPNYFRVIGSLQNSEDFARVFNCPVGTPMNPQHKCQVW